MKVWQKPNTTFLTSKWSLARKTIVYISCPNGENLPVSWKLVSRNPHERNKPGNLGIVDTFIVVNEYYLGYVAFRFSYFLTAFGR